MMSTAHLRLVRPDTSSSIPSLEERAADHCAILEGYLDTHILRGHTDETRESDQGRIERGLRAMPLLDPEHPSGVRPLFVLEAMAPFIGRERMIAYHKSLLARGLARTTLVGEITALRRFFA